MSRVRTKTFPTPARGNLFYIVCPVRGSFHVVCSNSSTKGVTTPNDCRNEDKNFSTRANGKLFFWCLRIARACWRFGLLSPAFKLHIIAYLRTQTFPTPARGNLFRGVVCPVRVSFHIVFSNSCASGVTTHSHCRNEDKNFSTPALGKLFFCFLRIARSSWRPCPILF